MKKSAKITAVLVLAMMISLLMASCAKEEDPSVGRVRLNIQTYAAGKDQPTHPSVVSFDEKWNGYKYWMAYTPYPEANGEEENPCIAVSNDLYKWETPYGMVNPIADNEETGCAELKDSHILYRDDIDRIEVWYLGRVSKNIGGDGESLTLFRKYSYDGVVWSSYEIMDTVEYLSPTVRWNGSCYQMWSIGFKKYGTTGTFVYQESEDGQNWTAPQECTIDGASQGLELWHGAVSYDDSTGKFVFAYIRSGSDSQTIEACESEDGIHFTNNQLLVKNGKDTLWQRFYRPYLLIERNEPKYHLFYGVITEDNKWYISYSKGGSLSGLIGITENDCKKMVPMDSVVPVTGGFADSCRKIYHQICNCIRLELGALVFLLLFVEWITEKKRVRSDLLSFLLCMSICSAYSCYLFRPGDILAFCGVFGAAIIESACIYSVSIVTYQRIKSCNRRRPE